MENLHLLGSDQDERDPQFAEKLEDIVGLCMSPPEHALVLCCDEKSQVQALDRIVMHFTPTSASWLNMVERLFRDITTARLRLGVFTSAPELVSAIDEYVEHHNTNPKPFIWTKSARDILQKVIGPTAA